MPRKYTANFRGLQMQKGSVGDATPTRQVGFEPGSFLRVLRALRG